MSIPRRLDDAKLLFRLIAAIEAAEPRLKARPWFYGSSSSDWALSDEIGFLHLTLAPRHGNLTGDDSIGSFVLVQLFTGVTYMSEDAKATGTFKGMWSVGDNADFEMTAGILLGVVHKAFASDVYELHKRYVAKVAAGLSVDSPDDALDEHDAPDEHS